MSKYIITNCPAIYRTCNDCSNNSGKQCQDINDCVLKRIVELCKENLDSLENYVDVRSLECTILQRILKLLDIQEVE